MKNIIILIGLPRSGKSTLRKMILEKYNQYVCISADDLRYIVYGQRYYSGGEPTVWATRGYMLTSLLQNGNDVIIDETNTTAKRRESIIKQAKKCDYNVIGIHINTEINVCLERADADIIDTINRMNEQFEIPEMEEGFNTIYTIAKNSYNTILQELEKYK